MTSPLTRRPLAWSGRAMTKDYAWVDEPMPTSGRVSMGYGGLSEAGPTDETAAYEFPVTVWGDYVGSTVERSNYRVLVEDYGDNVIEVLGGYNSQYIAVAASLREEDPETWAALEEIAVGLEDYPLINDEDHSLLEMEIADEAWDQWLRMDTEHDLGEIVDPELLDLFDPKDVESEYYRLTYDQNYGPECEGADSCYFPFHAQVVAELAEIIRKRVDESAEYVGRFGGLIALREPTDTNQGTF